MSNAKYDPEYPYDRDAELARLRRTEARDPAADTLQRASCQHLVQSNGTCGDSSCRNYGRS